MRYLPTAFCLALAAPACAAAADPIAQHDEEERLEARITAEAAAFMDDYGRELRAGDRAAIARRYDRRGAWHLGNGRKSFESWPALEAYYAGERWRRPVSFVWRELAYEVLGPDAVVVVGQFNWVAEAGRPPVTGSYTGLLVRQDGTLRIRAEHESTAPTPAS